MMKTKIAITGGGTGGHVFPALAIAEELKNRGYEILYVGSDRGMEARLAPQKGVRFVPIKTGPVKNQKFSRLVKTFFQLIGAVIWAWRLLRREKVAAVVGVGGYISVPVCVAGFLLRKPVFLQEQNVSVGIANRFLGRMSKRVFLGFDQAKRYFSPAKSVTTGNPIRKEFFASSDKIYDPNGKTLVILGGSQGARAINQVISQNLQRLPQDWHIIHQTGVTDYESVKAAYEMKYPGRAEVSAFIEDMVGTMAKATFVVSRSGAITVSELVQMGKPCLLVPFPRQGQNDQTDNARWLEDAGGAVMVEQGEGFSERFWAAWGRTVSPAKLTSMAQGVSALRRPPAIATICDRIEADLRS
jgi:UDP-N-acetylglucosamine--N-acetylmuramyl-(pentapeptide) pyrophosphoryl-undecaprenol N-acetylglucosamine transferase